MQYNVQLSYKILIHRSYLIRVKIIISSVNVDNWNYINLVEVF